jgi:hypothetical protein
MEKRIKHDYTNTIKQLKDQRFTNKLYEIEKKRFLELQKPAETTAAAGSTENKE